MTPHRSVSQLNQYERCPYAFKLARVDKAWSRPAAWLAQGSAVHEVLEAWEQSGRTMTLEAAQALFSERYEFFVNQSCDTTPNLDFWFASGPYRGQIDIERRYLIGLEQVEKSINWHLAHEDQVIWIAPDGTPGIEIGFDFMLDTVPVRGFIDAVRVVDGEVRVVDYKTGNSPGDDFQLGVYGVALAEMYGIEPPKLGEYFMAGKSGKPAKPTYPYNITEWTRERVSERFAELEDNIVNERFDPKPDPKVCNFCSVSYACEYKAI
jgi:putative RecB family exonuclease